MSAWKSWIGVELNVVSYKEKIVSAMGGFVAILTLMLITKATLNTIAAPLIASMGASAVLLFGVPHGQLSQPWPVIGGHVLSALIGVTCAVNIPHAGLAAAAAVSLSIGAMHQLKCIHPPGGATALTAVIGSPAIHALGFKFVLYPVLLNAAAITLIAFLFNFCFAWRRYPAVLNRPATVQKARPDKLPPAHEDVVRALRSLDSFVDVTEEDLVRISQILRSAHDTKRLTPEAGTSPAPQPHQQGYREWKS